MKKEQSDFVNEFTNNFAELFVESFLIKYSDMFEMDEFPKVIFEAQRNVTKKLKQKINSKLKAIGFNPKDYE